MANTDGQVLALTNRSVNSARKACRDGQIPARLICGQYQITKRALLRFLDGEAA